MEHEYGRQNYRKVIMDTQIFVISNEDTILDISKEFTLLLACVDYF